ncbi:MAG: class I SAM-dependent methyltransferase [Patescibacteria group bacterium]
MQHDVYRAMYEAKDAFWWLKGMQCLFDVFFRMHIRSAHNRILDIGCGPGVLFPVLRRYGDVYGIDISSEAVSYARKQGIAEEVLLGSGSALPYAADTFDAIVCSDLLYHSQVPSDTAVMREMHRALKPGGALIIKEAAYDWLRGRVDELVHTKHRYTKSELRDKLEQSHFVVERITYIMFFLFPAAFGMRLLERLFPRAYGASEMFSSPPLLNALFFRLVQFEAFLLRRCNFPFGLSIMAVARKKHHA